MTLKQDKEPTPQPEPKEVVEQPQKEAKAKEAPVTDKGGTTPEPAERWAGKSPEELLQIVREQDSMIGKQSTTIDTQKKDLEYYEQQISQPKTPQYPQGQQFPTPYGQQTYDPYGQPLPQQYGMPPWGQPQQEPPVQFNYENPMESVQTAVQRELQRADQKRQVEEARKYAYEAREGFEEGKNRARKSNPKLYEGIEKEVEGAIQGFYQQGFLRPSDMRREDTWETAAQVIRLKRGELNYLRPQSPSPMTPPHSETPASMTEETRVPIDLTGEHKDIADTFGLTEEEIEDSVKKRGAE